MPQGLGGICLWQNYPPHSGGEVWRGVDFFAGFKTIHYRHFHIHENEVGFCSIVNFDGLKPVAGSDGVVVLFEDRVDESNDGSRVVIHNENFRPVFWL
jgi:hypothetical protein